MARARAVARSEDARYRGLSHRTDADEGPERAIRRRAAEGCDQPVQVGARLGEDRREGAGRSIGEEGGEPVTVGAQRPQRPRLDPDAVGRGDRSAAAAVRSVTSPLQSARGIAA